MKTYMEVNRMTTGEVEIRNIYNWKIVWYFTVYELNELPFQVSFSNNYSYS